MNAIGPVEAPFASGKGRKIIEREARWTLLGYIIILAISIVLWTPAALIYWVGPMAMTKVFQMLENTAEHEGLPKVANIFENTRTIRTNAFMRWMGWQIQYHTAHHAFPGVPFHRLKELHHELLGHGIEPPTMTYLGFQRTMLMALWNKGEAEWDHSQPWGGTLPPAGKASVASKAVA